MRARATVVGLLLMVLSSCIAEPAFKRTHYEEVDEGKATGGSTEYEQNYNYYGDHGEHHHFHDNDRDWR